DCKAARLPKCARVDKVVMPSRELQCRTFCGARSMSESSRAQLDWDEHGQPLSRQFGDVYFSRASGLEETRHVFLHHSRIVERCAALNDDGRLVIGETGFGTGLNFLCAWQAFAEHAPAAARLHFISVEKYPL